MGLLSETEHAVIVGRFFAGETLKELGDKIGRTKERVRQIEQMALKRLRDRMVGGDGPPVKRKSGRPRKYG